MTQKRMNRLYDRGIIPEFVISEILELKDYDGPSDGQLAVFESHILCGFYVPTLKFLISVCQAYKIELVRLKPSAVASLSIFVMLCEC